MQGKSPIRQMPSMGGGTKTSTTVTGITRKGEAPAAPVVPGFEAPEWDEREIAKMTQRKAAPSLRRLRSQINEAMSRSYDNPNVKRMTLREALAGYGLGVEGIMSGAGSQATGEYGAKYGREFQASQIDYQAKVNTLMQSYQNAFQSWVSSGVQTSKTTSGPGTGTGESGSAWKRSDFGSQAWARLGFRLP